MKSAQMILRGVAAAITLTASLSAAHAQGWDARRDNGVDRTSRPSYRGPSVEDRRDPLAGGYDLRPRNRVRAQGPSRSYGGERHRFDDRRDIGRYDGRYGERRHDRGPGIQARRRFFPHAEERAFRRGHGRSVDLPRYRHDEGYRVRFRNADRGVYRGRAGYGLGDRYARPRFDGDGYGNQGGYGIRYRHGMGHYSAPVAYGWPVTGYGTLVGASLAAPLYNRPACGCY